MYMHLIFFEKKYVTKKRYKNKHFFKFLKKKNDFYLLLFKKKTYFNFFKKRLFLFKYYRRLARVFFRRFLKTFSKKKFFLQKNKLFKNEPLVIKKSIQKIFYKINLKKRNRKINFLRRYKYFIIKNASYFFNFNFSIKNYKLFFKKFKNFRNYNFFSIFFFNIYNIVMLSKLFFNKHFLVNFFKNQGVYVNGVLCRNIFFLVDFSKINFLQIIWSKSFFRYFINWYRHFLFKKTFFKRVRWLFFFRRVIQRKNYKSSFYKWMVKTKKVFFYKPEFLEIDYCTLSIIQIPLFFSKYHFYWTLKYLNILMHRIYLWKFII